MALKLLSFYLLESDLKSNEINFLTYNNSLTIFQSSFVQIEGKVLKPNVIECLRLQTISDGFDVINYNKALELSHGKFRDLFL